MKFRGKWVGYGLLIIAYLISAFLVFRRTTEDLRPGGRVTIRFAQWQLEGTMRQAFNQIIARYEQLNPNVHVIQLAIPSTVYAPWVQTQMVGGTGPDIAEYVWVWPDIARRFQPLDEDIAQPNPYNKGTALEGVPWRDTNIDAMSNDDSFVKSLSHYYGITISSVVTRIVYNRPLIKKITGADEPPHNYREFLALCQRIKDYAKVHQLNLAPLSCSQDTAPSIAYTIMGNMGTKLSEHLDYRHRLQIYQPQLVSQYLQGDWNFETPAMTAGLHVLTEMGNEATPGFVQRKRDAALIDFVAQRTAMAVMPSWEASNLPLLVSFDLGAFNFPYPREDDPAYGSFVKSPFGEGPRVSALGLYVNRHTRHRAEAIDFLRFMTSVEGSTIFTRVSNWQPATLGVEARGLAAQFTQITEGYEWNASYFGLTVDAEKFIQTRYPTLWNPNGGVVPFQTEMKSGLALRIRDDLRRENITSEHDIQREDCLAVAHFYQADHAGVPASLPLVTLWNETKLYQFARVLAQPDRPQP